MGNGKQSQTRDVPKAVRQTGAPMALRRNPVPVSAGH